MPHLRALYRPGRCRQQCWTGETRAQDLSTARGSWCRRLGSDAIRPPGANSLLSRAYSPIHLVANVTSITKAAIAWAIIRASMRCTLRLWSSYPPRLVDPTPSIRETTEATNASPMKIVRGSMASPLGCLGTHLPWRLLRLRGSYCRFSGDAGGPGRRRSLSIPVYPPAC